MKNSYIKFLKKIQNIPQYLPIIMGLTSYWYIKDKGVYRRNTISGTIAVAVNIMGVLCLLQDLINFLQIYENTEGQHRLVIIMSSFRYIQGLLVLCAIVHIWHKDTTYTAIKWQIEKLEEQSLNYFPKCKGIEGRFKKLSYLKYFFLTYLYLAVLIARCSQFSETMEFWTALKIIFLTNVQFRSNLIYFQYFQMFWKTCRIYSYIEHHTAYLADEPLRDIHTNKPFVESHLCFKLSSLLELHSNLGSCLRRLQILFKSQIFRCRYTVIVYNIIAVYYIFLYQEYMKDSLLHLILVVTTYIFNNLDLYVNDNMIDMTSQHFGNLNLNLKQFDGIRNSAKNLQLQVNVANYHPQ